MRDEKRLIRVLIADDDPGTCETLGDILTAEGYVVTTVEDGRAALAAARAERYDVVLVDQRMPGPEGHRGARPPPAGLLRWRPSGGRACRPGPDLPRAGGADPGCSGEIQSRDRR